MDVSLKLRLSAEDTQSTSIICGLNMLMSVMPVIQPVRHGSLLHSCHRD